MNSNGKNIKHYVVFSRWSRKAYAIFSSLGKIIKIGRLSVDIVQVAQLKNVSAFGKFSDLIFYSFKEIQSDEEGCFSDSGFENLNISLFLRQFNLATLIKNKSENIYLNINNIIYPSKSIFALSINGLFNFNDYDKHY